MSKVVLTEGLNEGITIVHKIDVICQFIKFLDDVGIEFNELKDYKILPLIVERF